MPKEPTVDISKITNPKGSYRYQICDLAWDGCMKGYVTAEEYKLYKEWFWELSRFWPKLINRIWRFFNKK